MFESCRDRHSTHRRNNPFKKQTSFARWRSVETFRISVDAVVTGCRTAKQVSKTMRRCEIAVVGLGLMGSSALYSLARRGADVLGFDPLDVGDFRGSSHGSCRVYRRFNFESTAYTDLSDAAFEGWRILESASGRTILLPSR